MRILITGATGFLGNNIIRGLLEDGHEIIAAIRVSSDPRPLASLKVETTNLDLRDSSQINLVVDAVDLVIHTAAMIHIGWKKLDTSRAVNVESTRILAEACRRKNVRLIYVSTVDTLAVSDGDAPRTEENVDPIKLGSAYITSKREAERVVLDEVQNGLDGVIVNPGFMIGPWDWKPSSGKMMFMLANMPVLFFVPAGGCSVVDVRDVAEGIISAASHGRTGERYILGGQNMSYLELWQLMAKIIERRPPVRKMSNLMANSVGGFLRSCFTIHEGRGRT